MGWHELEGHRLRGGSGLAGGLGSSLVTALEALQALAVQRVAEAEAEEQEDPP
jgi:hypothetical protein